MLGGITVLVIAGLVAIWFYRTAIAKEDDKPWTWAFIGVLCFYGFFTIWRVIVVRPVLLMLGLHHNDLPTFLIASSAILLAGLFTAFIRQRYLIKGKLE